MLFKLMLSIIIEIVAFLANIMVEILPDTELFIRYIHDFYELIGNYIQVIFNGLYFSIGEAIYPLTSIAISWMFIRYITIPFGLVIRRFFIKGGDT